MKSSLRGAGNGIVKPSLRGAGNGIVKPRLRGERAKKLDLKGKERGEEAARLERRGATLAFKPNYVAASPLKSETVPISY